MKKETLIALLGLEASASEADITASITALMSKASASENVAEACVALGEKAGFVNKDNKEGMTRIAKLDPSAFLALIPTEGKDSKKDKEESTPQAQEPITLTSLMQALQGAGTGEKPPKEKGYNDYTVAELDEMEAKEPEKFKKLFDNEFNS